MVTLVVRSGSLVFGRIEMTSKYGRSANGSERERTLPTFAMQKVVGSSPIIRFTNQALS